jgi:hypothetical protein
MEDCEVKFRILLALNNQFPLVVPRDAMLPMASWSFATFSYDFERRVSFFLIGLVFC